MVRPLARHPWQFNLRQFLLLTTWICAFMAVVSQIPRLFIACVVCLWIGATLVALELYRGHRSSILFSPASCFLLAGACCGLWGWAWLGDPFDAATWQQASGAGDGANRSDRSDRGEMIDDLLQRHDFKGWHRSDVVALLGQPDPQRRHRWAAQQGGDDVYNLGWERAFFPTVCEFLVFRFDDDDRVIDYQVRRADD